MTMDEFFQELERIFSQPGGAVKVLERGAIMARAPGDNYDGFFDSPLSALAHALKPGAPHWMGTAAVNAGKEIDLSPEEAKEIDEASWSLPGHNPALRARLMQTLRHLLPEQTAAA